MKTAISLPDPLFDAAERLSKRLGISRSRLYAQAIEDFLASHRTGRIKEKLNEVYRTESSELDPVRERMQGLSLWREDW